MGGWEGCGMVRVSEQALSIFALPYRHCPRRHYRYIYSRIYCV